MVSSALADRMAAFEKGGPIKKQPGVANRAAAFEKGNVTNANKSYKSNTDLTGIEDRSNKSWASRKTTPSKVDASGSVTSTGTPKKVGFNPPDKENDTKSRASANSEGRVHGSVKHPWSEKKNLRVEQEEKKGPADSTQASTRPGLKNTAIENISKRRLEQEKNAKPANPKQRKKQILKCLAISVLIIACIVIATITIVTGWGDGSIETEFDKQATVFGKLVSLSQDGFVAVVLDDFGSNQVYRLDPNANPKWQPMGQQFRSQGRVQVSGDGKRLAYVNPRTKRLVFETYDEVMRDWVDSQDAPILGGDDVSLSGDFATLVVGTFGQGSITIFNQKMGEGIITTYKYDGSSWVAHGEPLEKIFGMTWFGVSPDGTGLLVMADHEGNTTLNGYRSETLSNTLGDDFEWVKADRATTFPSIEIDVSVSNGGYAVSTAAGAQAYTFSGRTLGQEITPAGNNNITAVALSTDGRTMAVGSITPGLTGLVDWYRFPAGTTDNWAYLGKAALQDNAANFGSSIQINEGSTQVAVQSGTAGDENVHFYSVTYKTHRAIG